MLTSVALAVGLFVEPTVVTGAAGLVVVVVVVAVLAYVAWLLVFLWTNPTIRRWAGRARCPAPTRCLRVRPPASGPGGGHGGEGPRLAR